MKKITLPFLLFCLLLMAACGGTAASPPAEPSLSESAAVSTDEMASHDDTMDDMASDDTMDDMASDDMMDDMASDDTMDDMASDDTMDDMASDDTMDDMASDDTMDDMASDDTMDDMADRPIWQTLSLTNAQTNASFTLADFAGKTVFVEPMATWCSNCRRQMGNVQEAQANFGDDVVFVALSVETNISAADLATYATNQGFNFHFAVMTPEFLQALAAEFGQTVANPPATPHFIIRPDGSFTGLTTGIESADQIRQHIEAAQG